MKTIAFLPFLVLLAACGSAPTGPDSYEAASSPDAATAAASSVDGRRPRVPAAPCYVFASYAGASALRVRGSWTGAGVGTISTEAGASTRGGLSTPFDVFLPYYMPGAHEVTLLVVNNGATVCSAFAEVTQ